MNNRANRKIRCAVVGTGSFGQFHAQKYATLKECHLVAVVDVNFNAAWRISQKYAAHALNNYRSLLGQIDAVSIVVPTAYHYPIARDFLEAGTHVLIEKPITSTVQQAEELIQLAQANKCVLQVGFLERFNPVTRALGKLKEQPIIIESRRLSPFNTRTQNVGVVLDLMTHDIDITLSLIDSKIRRIQAQGSSILTHYEDIAYAQITFENGSIAHLATNRISPKIERTMQISSMSSQIEIDFIHTRDLLLDEIKDFIMCIQTGKKPLVSGEAGRDTLKTAIQIMQILKEARHDSDDQFIRSVCTN